jgi:hypothetical protein
MQFFHDGLDFYAYDPGFRIQGEAPHIYLKHLYGIDQRTSLIDFSLSRSANASRYFPPDSYRFNGKFARTIWILGNVGTVKSIWGIREISDHKNVVYVFCRLKPGDSITQDMQGTERQVLLRVYLIADSHEELDEANLIVSRCIKIEDVTGNDMIQDLHFSEK